MPTSTVIAAIMVAMIVSLLAAIVGYYLQNLLKKPSEVPLPAPEEREIPQKIPETKLMSPLRPELLGFLVITKGDRAGTEFRLSTGSTIIGRAATLCDIVIADPTISGQHAKITLDGDDFHLYDLASMNGTFVNGKPITHAILQDGDRVQMGQTEFVFKVVR